MSEKQKLRDIYEERTGGATWNDIARKHRIGLSTCRAHYREAQRLHTQGWLYGDWAANLKAKLDSDNTL